MNSDEYHPSISGNPRGGNYNTIDELSKEAELTNFAEAKLSIMEPSIGGQYNNCHKCSINSSHRKDSKCASINNSGTENISSNRNNDNYVDDSVFVVSTNSCSYGSNPAIGNAFIGGHGDNVPFVTEDHLQSEVDGGLSGDSHCHVSEPRMSASAMMARRQLIISSVLCLIFMIAEVIGGYFANSLAIMTDAAHMLSDFASFMISLFAVYMGQKKPTRKMSFGYYRAEVLGAVTSVLIIWLVSGVIVYMAIQRIIKQEFNIDADIMLIVSGCGVAMNILMGIVLHGMCNCHTHSHGFGSHGHSHDDGNHNHSHGGIKKERNINVRAALIHVIGDLIQSIGVLIAAYIIKYKPEYKLADPICTFIFSAVVLFTTISIMKDALYVLMEGFPKNVDYYAVLSDLKELEGVKTVHSLHVWSLTLDKNALSAHLAIKPQSNPQEVLRTALSLVRKKYQIFHPTIQIEMYDLDMISCGTCQGPEK